MPALLVAGLVLGHALIHASYLAPIPAPKAGAPAWPFRLDRSWLLGPLGIEVELSRVLGVGLIGVVIAGFGLATLACLGMGPEWFWRIGIALGAVSSLAVLALYFHPWLVLGIVVDLVLLWTVAVGAWVPAGVGG